MDKVSVIIPARNEQFLQKTIECVLGAAEEEVEVIAVCDGNWPTPPVKDHPSVNLIHHSAPRGQRQSINAAARIATGKYILKLDAHCTIAKGWDKVLKEDCKYEWTMVPTMFNLDVEKFEPKLNKKTNYMWISSPTHEQPFRSQYFRRQPENDKQIDEIMTCMGPGWFMHKDRYWELGGLDEGHGGWGQMGVEVALKAWLSGGALMVNKKTWFSHWFRGGGVPVGFKSGFPYSIKQRDIDAARAYSQDLWLNNKWPKQVRTTQWLVEKFKPPSWEFTQGQNSVDDINKYFYHHIHLQKKDPTWKGLTCIKMPSDLVLYAQVIQAEKPKWIVETGTAYGGSSLYFQDILELVGEGGKVVTIDKEPERRGVTDPRITYLVGSSADSAIVEQVKTMVGKDSVMVILDSDHSRQHVKWELHYYAPLVTSGQYLVVEDCFDRHGRPWGPGEARDWFLPRHPEFVQTNLDHRYVVGVCRGGWLKRK